MKNNFTITIPPGQAKERLDLYLTSHTENATRNKVQEAIKNGEVLVNGVTVKPSYAVQPGDRIDVRLSRPDPPEVKAENIPLTIVYEDETLLVVNKPAGMVTHPAYKNYSGTLVNALMFHSEKLSSLHAEEDEEFDTVRPGIVHRLDKDTSGLLVVAKDETTHQKLAKQFAEKTSEREYQAVVWGVFRETSGVIEAPLGRSKSDRKKVAVTPDGKQAVTEYEVMEQFEFLALLRLHLRTGRTHQIRVHLAHIHHPVFGDETYGGRELHLGKATAKTKAQAHNLLDLMPRQALHAKKLGFIHPQKKKMMRFESDLPADMQALLSSLR